MSSSLSSSLLSASLEDSSPSSLALEGFSKSSVLGFEFVSSDVVAFALASEIHFFFIHLNFLKKQTKSIYIISL